MKKHSLIVIVVVLVLAVSGVLWMRLSNPVAPVKGGDLALLIDNSSSETVDCAAIGALATAELSELAVGKASHLMVFTLGDARNSFEPKPQLDLRLQTGAGGRRKAARAVEKACGEFGVVDSSSIFRATELVLTQLQTRGLAGSHLVVQTDGEENVDDRQQRKYTKKTALLNNMGVKTLICGIAVTNAGGPRGAHADQLLKTWKADFAEPGGVVMQPFCPGQGNAERASR